MSIFCYTDFTFKNKFICMKKSILLGGIILCIFFISGCGNDDAGSNNENVQNTTPTNTSIVEESFMLEAESLGKGEVRLSWKVPSDMDVSAGLVIVRSNRPAPTYPKSYWFRQASDRRTRVWDNIPSGEQYFRICQLIAGECNEYSNEVMVKVE